MTVARPPGLSAGEPRNSTGMPKQKPLPQPDFSRDYASDSEEDAEAEDPTASGGINAAGTESDESNNRRERKDDDENEEEEEEQDSEAEEDGRGQPDDDDVDSSEISSEDDDDFIQEAFSRRKRQRSDDGDGGTPQDASSSARSSPGTGRNQHKSWVSCLHIQKGDRPSAGINQEITSFLENDLRLAEYHPRREDATGKRYWEVGARRM